MKDICDKDESDSAFTLQPDVFKTPAQSLPKRYKSPLQSYDDSKLKERLPTKQPIYRRRTLGSKIEMNAELVPTAIVESTSTIDQVEIIEWFRDEIKLRVLKTALYSTATLSPILVAATLLTNSFNSPWYTLFNILSPFLQPTLFLFVLLVSSFATFINALIISYLYRNDNIFPCLSDNTTIFNGDMETLKVRIEAFILASFSNIIFISTLWNQPSNWGTILILTISTCTTLIYTLLWKTDYCLILNAKNSEKPFNLSLRQFHPVAVYTYIKNNDFQDYLSFSLKTSCILQSLQFLLIWIIELLFGLNCISNSFILNIQLLIFKFACILMSIQIHNYSHTFILERITFQFPEKYDISQPTIQQKANLRSILLTSDVFLKMFAFHDLLMLLEGNELRKHAIYELSTPGNNPLNWNSIKNASLNEITTIISELQEARKKLIGAENSSDVEDGDIFNQSMLMMNPIQRIQMCTKSVNRRHQTCLRKKPEVSSGTPEIVAKTYISPYSKVTVQLAIKGLVNILVSSLENDRFGIVQKSSSTILRTILHLSSTIDMYVREKKKVIGANDGVDMEWLAELTDTIRSSITDFNIHFKEHIASFGLSPEEKCALYNIVAKRFVAMPEAT